MSISKEEILAKANEFISKDRNETHGDAFKKIMQKLQSFGIYF